MWQEKKEKKKKCRNTIDNKIDKHRTRVDNANANKNIRVYAS